MAGRADGRKISTLMIVAGAICAVAGILPVAAVVVLVIGIWMKVAARLRRTPATA